MNPPKLSDPPDAAAVAHYLRGLQERSVQRTGCARPLLAGFIADRWQRAEGGHGETRILSRWQRCSNVPASASPTFSGASFRPRQAPRVPSWRAAAWVSAMERLAGRASAQSYLPTAHLNVRFFIAEKPGEPAVWWFGGGFDLSPCYGYRGRCPATGTPRRAPPVRVLSPQAEISAYPRLKQSWRRVFLSEASQGAPRKFAALFFDDWNVGGFARSLALMRSVGDHFLPAYLLICERRRDTPTKIQRQRDWQLYWRGRYVEFNLVYDRGTLFGLQSGGRSESILMSMPPLAAWRYDHQPEPGSAEAELYEKFLRPRDWLAP